MLHEVFHFMTSLLIALAISLIFTDLLLGLFTFLAGMLLDGDHMLDYMLYLATHKQPFSLKEFLSGTYFPIWKKFITPLHSWELVILCTLLYVITLNPYLLGFAAALAAHYIVDYVTNDVNKKAYFFLFRLAHGFLKAAIKR